MLNTRIHFGFLPAASGTLPLFHYQDLSDGESILNRTEETGYLSASPDTRFAHCTLQDVSCPAGSVSLYDCTAKAVSAAGNVFLRGSSVEEVEADGDVLVLNCRDIQRIRAGGRVFFDEQISGVKVEGDLTTIIVHTEPW